MSEALREAARAEFLRLRGDGRPRGRPHVCYLKVSEPMKLPGGPTTACLLGCGFCGVVLSGMGGPGGPGIVCQACATAIRDESHPLGMLLRNAWEDALRALFRESEAPAATTEGGSHGA